MESIKKNSFAESLDGILDPDIMNSNPNVFKDLQSHYGEMMNNPMEIFDDYQIKAADHKIHLGNKFPGPHLNTNMKANILSSIQEESSFSDIESANPDALNIKE